MASGRSFADPLSSSMQFTAYDLARGLGDLLFYRLPYFALPQVLHELTHQWCFNSVVGRTITYLLFRAQREAALGDPHGRVWREASRAELIQQILLPLAEGMALFAEHDLYPGSFESTARPLLACAPLVATLDPEKGVNLYDNLSRKILAARMRPLHWDRKASLLLEPLNSYASPYSLGYLTVKALQVKVAQRDERLRDSDLFLQVLHGYFYEDWDLVAELLAEDFPKHDVDAQERLLGYLGNRLDGFAEAVDSGALDDFIARSVNPSYQRQLFRCDISGIGHGFWVYEFKLPVNGAGRSRLEALMQDALDLALIHDERLGTLVTTQLFINASAQVITLGGADVAAKRLPYHLMLMMDDTVPSAALPYSGTLPDGWVGTLRVVVALFVEQASLIVLMFDGEKLVADVGLEQLRKRTAADNSRLLDLIANPMLDPRQRSEIGALLREIVKECVGEAGVRRRHAIHHQIDTIYLSALDFVHKRRGAAAEIVSKLPQHTLSDLLNDDVELVESVAIASLLAASPFVLAEPPTDPAKMCEHIRVANRQLARLFGFLPIIVGRNNNPIYSAV